MMSSKLAKQMSNPLGGMNHHGTISRVHMYAKWNMKKLIFPYSVMNATCF